MVRALPSDDMIIWIHTSVLLILFLLDLVPYESSIFSRGHVIFEDLWKAFSAAHWLSGWSPVMCDIVYAGATYNFPTLSMTVCGFEVVFIGSKCYREREVASILNLINDAYLSATVYIYI